MTALVITASAVIAGANARTEPGISGATIEAKHAVYKDADGTFKLSDADSATAAVRSVYGIALNTASAGQPLVVQRGGDITLGAVLTVGEIYVLGDAAGGIMPASDLGTGDYVAVIGVARTTSVLQLGINNSGVAG